MERVESWAGGVWRREFAGDRRRVQGRRCSEHEGGVGEGADYLGGEGQVLHDVLLLHPTVARSRIRPFCRIL